MKGYALSIVLALVLGGLAIAHLTKPPPQIKDKHEIMRWIIQQNASCANQPKK